MNVCFFTKQRNHLILPIGYLILSIRYQIRFATENLLYM